MKPFSPSHRSSRTSALLAAGLLSLAACEDEREPTVNVPDAAPVFADASVLPPADAAPLPGQADAGVVGDAGVADTAPTPTVPPLYLIHTAVQDSTGRVNHFNLIESVREPSRLDYTKSLLLPGRARLYTAPGIGFFALGAGEAPEITRYQISPAGTFAKGATMSLQPQGVKNMAWQAVLFVSPTKAYYKDPDEGQIIVWNPTDMSFVKSIPLPDDAVTPPDGYLSSFSQWAARPGEAFFTITSYTKAYDRVAAGTTLVRIDTITDAVTVGTDARCRGLVKTGERGGTLYFFSDVINGFGHAVYPNDGGQPDCFLRIEPGQTRFDPTYIGSIAAAYPNQFATVVALTSDGRAWVQSIDDAEAPKAPGTTYLQWYAKGWKWSSVNLLAPTQAQFVPGEPGAYAGTAFAMGGDVFISQTKADYSETTMVNLAATPPAPGLSFAGFTLDIAQVR